MKIKTLILIPLALIICNCSSQINLNKISSKVKEQVNNTAPTTNTLSNEEVIRRTKRSLNYRS